MKICYSFLLLALFFIPLTFAKTSHPKIIFLGDSLTEGYGISPDKSFPKLIEKELLKLNPSVTVTNAGSSGSTSASAVSRLKWLLKSKPTILVLALGANDGLRGLKLQSTKTNLSKAIKLASDNNVKVVLAGVRIPVNYGPNYRNKFEKIYSQLAKEYDVTFIPYLLKGVAGIKKYNLPDQIHPNESGHAIITQTILPYLKKLL